MESLHEAISTLHISVRSCVCVCVWSFSPSVLPSFSLSLLYLSRSSHSLLGFRGRTFLTLSPVPRCSAPLALSLFLSLSLFSLLSPAFKRTGRLVVTVAMLLLTFGALIAYFVIIGSLLESAVVTFVERGKGLTIVLPTPAPGAKAVPHAEAIAVAKAVGVPPWLLQSPFLSGLALICPILPLGSLKNMSALGFVSLVALSSVACLIALVVQDGARAAAAGTTPTPALAAWGPRVFFTIPTVALAYTNQPNIYEIADELHNPTVRRVAAVINISTIATTFLYFLVGVFGYVHFGTGTATNILLNYPPAELSLVDAVLFTGGKLAMAIAMIGSYPLLLFPSRICLHSLIVQLPRLTMSIVHKWCKRSAYERCDPTAATSCCARCSLPPNVFFYRSVPNFSSSTSSLSLPSCLLSLLLSLLSLHLSSHLIRLSLSPFSLFFFSLPLSARPRFHFFSTVKHY